MDFSKRHDDPRRHLVGISFVVLFHGLIVYALVTGLAKKVVDVVRAPIETKVIEEIKKPPPPPEIVLPPPPVLNAPPPPFIPPPEVTVATPPPPAPTITAVTPEPPPAPVVIAPAPPPPPAPAPVAAAPPPPAPPPPAPPAPPPPKPVVASVAGSCTKIVKPEAPADTVNALIEVQFAVVDGKVTKIDVLKQSYTPNINPRARRAYISAIEAALSEYVCPGDHSAFKQEFAFKPE
jgi:periplasmic protein TonB